MGLWLWNVRNGSWLSANSHQLFTATAYAHTLGGKFTDGPAVNYRKMCKGHGDVPAARARWVVTGHSTQMHEVGRIRLLLCSPESPFWCIVIVQVENVCGLLLDWQDESAGGLCRLGLVVTLTWLDLEVQRYQREDEALQRVRYAWDSERRAFSPTFRSWTR
jgi:hypothetical protein